MHCDPFSYSQILNGCTLVAAAEGPAPDVVSAKLKAKRVIFFIRIPCVRDPLESIEVIWLTVHFMELLVVFQQSWVQ